MNADHVAYALLLIGVTAIVMLSFVGAGLYLRSRRNLKAVQRLAESSGAFNGNRATSAGFGHCAGAAHGGSAGGGTRRHG